MLEIWKVDNKITRTDTQGAFRKPTSIIRNACALLRKIIPDRKYRCVR